VEPAEIDNSVMLNQAVRHALTKVFNTKNYENYMACYYIENENIEPAEIRAFLKDILPDYMIPSFFVKMDKFPLNINGKIDRSALPEPEELLYLEIEYEAPHGWIEAELADIWADVLNLEKTGVNNSFMDLGGDSLRAMRAVSRIFKTFGVQIQFKDIFPDATIRHQAGIIEKTLADKKADDCRAEAGQEDGWNATPEEMAMLNE